MASSIPEPCHFLTLPPELRNMIYINYLEMYPEVILPDLDSTAVVPRAPLMRVNQQTRHELAYILTFYATHLLVRIDGSQMVDLAATVEKFDKRTLSAMHADSTHPANAPSQTQLLALQEAQALRRRGTQTLAASLRQYPSLRVLKIDLHLYKSSGMFEWAHKMEDNRTYRALAELRLRIEPSKTTEPWLLKIPGARSENMARSYRYRITSTIFPATTSERISLAEFEALYTKLAADFRLRSRAVNSIDFEISDVGIFWSDTRHTHQATGASNGLSRQSGRPSKSRVS